MSSYRFGMGVYDITGPAAECGMMGYSMPEQRTAGIHMRVRSRAFIVGTDAKRVVYVTAECGQLFQGVSIAVLEELERRFPSEYSEENVCLTASHTHSGPGGYSHYALYNLGTLGYDPRLFDVIVRGIVESIAQAHRRFEASNPGRVRIVEGELEDCGFNRSPSAYLRNPAAERAAYSHDTNRTMTLLRFEDESGTPVGMLNWFAVHPTNVGNRNTLITSDNKGYAAYLFEREYGRDYLSDNGFVAGFAQSSCGDVSPNLWGHPDNIHDFDRMRIIGERQYRKARELFDRAGEELDGEVSCAHVFLDMEHIAVDEEWIAEGERAHVPSAHTCTAGIGVSVVSGSTEDGAGASFIPEGMTYGGRKWPKITFDPELQRCHAEKALLVATGRMEPHPWTPPVLPIQLLRIGQLVLAAFPSEITTMAARRLRKTIENALPDAKYIVVAAYANAYAGYVTTREEYAAQHYEGASTLFGPYTLNAYQQEFHRLATAMRQGRTLTSPVRPADLRDAQAVLQPGVLFDLPPLFGGYGKVSEQPAERIARGQRARTVFWGAHPKNDFRTQSTFLEVQRHAGGVWETVARDWDPETVFHWKRVFPAMSKITVEWYVGEDVPVGDYRMRHFGRTKGGKEYAGTSRTFRVE